MSDGVANVQTLYDADGRPIEVDGEADRRALSIEARSLEQLESIDRRLEEIVTLLKLFIGGS